jgi:hypothetical protein
MSRRGRRVQSSVEIGSEMWICISSVQTNKNEQKKHCIFIQDVSRFVDITAGCDFLGLCDQKSSYEHGSDFERLRSYGHILISVQALVWIASSGSAGGWRTLLVGLWFSLQALLLPRDSPTQLQKVQFPYLDTGLVFTECGEGGVGGYSPVQCTLHDSASTTCSKTLKTYITATVPAPDVQNSEVRVS